MKKSLLGKILVYLILIAGILIIFFPLYLTVVTAFKTPVESGKNFFAPPSSFYLENFKNVISKSRYFSYVLNSLIITAASVAIMSIFLPMVSYAIARNMNTSKYYNFLYYFIIMGLFIPFQVIMIPVVKMMNKINMMSIPGIIILYITFSLMQGVFLFVGYIRTIPTELEESAFIDGCTVFQTFIRIIYPLIKPMNATVIILNSLWIWNDFLLPLLILNKTKDLWTLQLFQYNFKSQYTFDYNLAFASFTLSMLPIMIIYMFVQRYIIEGLTSGALKS